MAPRPTRRGDGASPKDFYEFGQQGRQTGATLRDTGQRDKDNMQPLDILFTSPQVPEPTPKPVEATPRRKAGGEQGSDDMVIASTPGPGPATVLGNRKSFDHFIPKGRAPIKTNLKSPARKSPHISSPARPRPSPSAQKNTNAQRRIAFPTANTRPSAGSQGGRRPGSNAGLANSDDSSAGGDLLDGDVDIGDMVNQSQQLVDANRTDPTEPNHLAANRYRPEIPPARAPPLSAKAQGKQKATPRKSPAFATSRFQVPSDDGSDVSEPPPAAEPEPPSESDHGPAFEPEPSPEPLPSRPRPSPKQKVPLRHQTHQSPRQPQVPRKHTPAAPSTVSATRDQDADYDLPPRKRRAESVLSKSEPPRRGRGRPPKNAPAKRPRGRPRKSETERNADEEESLFMTLQRGPPMPRSRGLVSVRHVSQNAANSRRGFSHPAAERDDISEPGRNNLATGYNDYDDYNEAIITGQAPRRADSAQLQRRHRLLPEDEELETWEVDPGTITGEIVLWEPEHEAQPPADDDPVQVTDECVAMAASAIQTTEIRDSAVRFAKTLATPFMGAGVVDLPPGSEKRPKNSRKMHMVFVVHYGKVTVTINEAQFRISAGGMWFVPRGNYYSITNESDEVPCRVYFSQACEVAPVFDEEGTPGTE